VADTAAGSKERECAECSLPKGVEEDEWAQIVAVRILSSTGYYVLCILMVFLSTFLIIWMASGQNDTTWWFVLLEVIVTVTIVAEVAVQMASQRACSTKEYWSSWWNIVDVAVMFLCIASFLVYIMVDSPSSRAEKKDDVVTFAALIIRYIAQGLRLLSLVIGARKMHAIQRVQEDFVVDFSQHDDEEGMEKVGQGPTHPQGEYVEYTPKARPTKAIVLDDD